MSTKHSDIGNNHDGLSIHDFEIIEKLGKGGFGEVYLCRKKDTNEVLALKIMEKSLIWKRNKVRQIKNERDVLAKNSTSKYIVHLIYSFQDKSNLYLAMEYCAGGDLRHFLSDIGVLSENDAKIYMAQMILATKYLHDCGYIHRDLKPDNFLIDKNGRLKLADFGLSKEGAHSNVVKKHQTMKKSLSTSSFNQSSKRLSIAFSVVGSPNYMSPEVLISSEENGYGEEVDWWSLGCIFFEMLIGFPPFTGATPDEVFENILDWKSHFEKVMDLNKDMISNEAYDFIKCFICEKQNRYGSSSLNKIKKHPFYNGFDWESLDNMDPPFIPHLNDEFDTSYFKNHINKDKTMSITSSIGVDVNNEENIMNTSKFNTKNQPSFSKLNMKVKKMDMTPNENKYHFRKRSHDQIAESRKSILKTINNIESKRKRYSYKEKKSSYYGITTPNSYLFSPEKEILGFTFKRNTKSYKKKKDADPIPINFDT